jgi:type II secretion system protein C
MKKFFKKLFSRPAKAQTVTVSKRRSRAEWGAKIKNKIPRNLDALKFDPKKIQLESVSEHQNKFRWGLILLSVLLASALASRITGLLLKPTYTPIPPKPVNFAKPVAQLEDLSVIEQRNIFDNENKIPDPFDQGMLDCWSQARPSSARLNLLGTIVMNDESLSVALVEDQGGGRKLAVKKDEVFFDGKYQALKVDRKKFCFQVKSTQEFEYIQIPEEGGFVGAGLAMGGGPREGISVVGENQFQIQQNFLESQLNDLSNVLQTAKAVPAIEGGKMKGFLIQSIDEDSVFATLGLGAGDVLSQVNGIVLDNAGKGLEAFTALKGSKKIELTITRGGKEQTLSYEVK